MTVKTEWFQSQHILLYACPIFYTAKFIKRHSSGMNDYNWRWPMFSSKFFTFTLKNLLVSVLFLTNLFKSKHFVSYSKITMCQKNKLPG